MKLPESEARFREADSNKSYTYFCIPFKCIVLSVYMMYLLYLGVLYI